MNEEVLFTQLFENQTLVIIADQAFALHARPSDECCLKPPLARIGSLEVISEVIN